MKVVTGSYCPNCNFAISSDATSCPSCQALFASDGWQPIAERPAGKNGSAAELVVKLGVASVVIPLIAFAIGMLVGIVVPGCECDTGRGCHGCGPNWLVENILFGGFVGALFSAMFVLPSCLVLAGLISLFTKRET
jgi:hypothetical protein